MEYDGGGTISLMNTPNLAASPHQFVRFIFWLFLSIAWQILLDFKFILDRDNVILQPL